MSPLLRSRIQVSYGASHALFGISMQVRPGEVVVLFGCNGAGKTTTLKSIMGVLANVGVSCFHGRKIAGLNRLRSVARASAMSPKIAVFSADYLLRKSRNRDSAREAQMTDVED